MTKERRGHYLGNGKDDVSESECELWGNQSPVNTASREMQDLVKTINF